MKLAKSVALVTGGATGIGRAVCLDLARAGAAGIVINYSKSREDAERTAKEVEAFGAEPLPVMANVASEKAVISLVDQTIKRFGRLDVLVNCAGATRFIPFVDLAAVTDEVWRDILSVNLMGPWYASRAAAPYLKQTRGCIVNIASLAALRASGSSIPYGVSKAALAQLTRALAVALAPEVRVNSVNPGLVKTRWFRQAVGNEYADAHEKATAERTPLKSVTTPDEVSQVVMSLITADMVTGQSVSVDGGLELVY